MELRKNLSVLPSNAPALSPRNSILSPQAEELIRPLSSQICENFNHGNECRVCNLYHICSTCSQEGHGAYNCNEGILRVSSGNAGLALLEPGVLDTKLRVDQQYTNTLPSTFVKPQNHTAQAAIRLTQKKERRNLWVRWETTSERYKVYRRKARSKKPGSKEDVWPDDVEEAFQIAIRLYAKRGRTKDELNGRQAGGNEFISDFILKKTGKERDRKQISSHIQTLKGFLQDIPQWMDLVTAWPAGRADKTKVTKQHNTGSEDSSDLVESVSLDRASTSRQSHDPSQASILRSNAFHEPSIRSLQFGMHLQTDAALKTHVYTHIQSTIGAAAKGVDYVPNWRDMFPKLAARHDQDRIDCPIFLFESRLRLIDEIRPNLQLAVELCVDFAGGAHFQDWHSVTRIHKQDTAQQYFNDSEFENSPADEVDCFESTRGRDDVRLGIAFKSSWWVKLFSSFITRRDRARIQNDRDALKAAEDYPSAYLRQLSFMQELWATPRIGDASRRPQRMAVLLWTFGRTGAGEAATTTWRPFTLPPSASPYQIQEPPLRALQPPMNLDSALQCSIAQQPRHSIDYYGSQRNNSLFTEDSEQLLTGPISQSHTEATTPILDYTYSFPSSTTTSFPSSVSNSTYPTHHGSSFDSQDSQYESSLDTSFHSQQGSHYQSNRQSNSSFKSMDSGYDQDHIYNSQPPSAYPTMTRFPSFDDQQPSEDNTLVAHTQPDFSSNAVQLGFAAQAPVESNEQHRLDVYETPMIAPRANNLSHEQLEQQLHTFEHWIPPAPTSLMLQEAHELEGNPREDRQISPTDMRGFEGSHEQFDNGNNGGELQQQQLHYLNEAAQKWGGDFSPALWAATLQMPTGLSMPEQCTDGVRDERREHRPRPLGDSEMDMGDEAGGRRAIKFDRMNEGVPGQVMYRH